MSRMTMAFLLAWALPIAGCGTVGNFAHDKQVYGGTRLDGAAFVKACKEFTHPDEPCYFTLNQRTMVVLGCCYDIPLCLVADTLTLPITLVASQAHHRADEHGHEVQHAAAEAPAPSKKHPTPLKTTAAPAKKKRPKEQAEKLEVKAVTAPEPDSGTP